MRNMMPRRARSRSSSGSSRAQNTDDRNCSGLITRAPAHCHEGRAYHGVCALVTPAGQLIAANPLCIAKFGLEFLASGN
ncbi:protein of unknown function [Aminobacter niigataensis]|nr:protein of unknown function [Aminobacter niigataensis]